MRNIEQGPTEVTPEGRKDRLSLCAVLATVLLVASYFIATGPGGLLSLLVQGNHLNVEVRNYGLEPALSNRQLAISSVWLNGIIGIILYVGATALSIRLVRSRLRWFGIVLLIGAAAILLRAALTCHERITFY